MASSSMDTDKLSLGLDDIIRLDRTTNPNRRGGGGGANRGFRSRGGAFRGRGQGFVNNGFRRGNAMQRSFTTPQGKWQHDLYEDNTNIQASFNKQQRPQRQSGGGANATTKLLISNLDYGVTTNDIQELFEDIGPIRIARVHYDKSGRSLGTAEVVFERRADAMTAQNKYNTLNLDSRPMDIRLVGVDDSVDFKQQNRPSYNNGNDVASYRNGRGGVNRSSGGNSNGFGGGQRGNVRNRTSNNNQSTNSRGGNRASRGGGGGKQQNGTSSVTAEDLDSDLDAYRAENKKK